MKRQVRVRCDECGARSMLSLTEVAIAAYRRNDWIWLCADCYSEGDGEWKEEPDEREALPL